MRVIRKGKSQPGYEPSGNDTSLCSSLGDSRCLTKKQRRVNYVQQGSASRRDDITGPLALLMGTSSLHTSSVWQSQMWQLRLQLLLDEPFSGGSRLEGSPFSECRCFLSSYGSPLICETVAPRLLLLPSRSGEEKSLRRMLHCPACTHSRGSRWQQRASVLAPALFFAAFLCLCSHDPNGGNPPRRKSIAA